MPRASEAHALVTPIADAHQQVATGTQTALNPKCTALILSARAQNMWVTFDGSVPSASNGITIIATAQPVYIPLGAHNGDGTIRAVEAAATGLLDILQLA